MKSYINIKIIQAVKSQVAERRKKALIFEQPDITGASETDLSSVILNRTVKDKVTFQSET